MECWSWWCMKHAPGLENRQGLETWNILKWPSLGESWRIFQTIWPNGGLHIAMIYRPVDLSTGRRWEQPKDRLQMAVRGQQSCHGRWQLAILSSGYEGAKERLEYPYSLYIYIYIFSLWNGGHLELSIYYRLFQMRISYDLVVQEVTIPQ